MSTLRTYKAEPTRYTSALVLNGDVLTFSDNDGDDHDIDLSTLTELTSPQIKAMYEGEDDTNAYTDAAKAVVDGVPMKMQVMQQLTGSLTLRRWDEILEKMDIEEMVNGANGRIAYIRYTGDDDSSVYFRDVMTYDADNMLIEIKHYYNKPDLSAESGKTTLTIVDKQLTSIKYEE